MRCLKCGSGQINLIMVDEIEVGAIYIVMCVNFNSICNWWDKVVQKYY